MRRSSSVALGGGKVTRRDSEHKIEASVIESEYTSSASGTD